MSSNPQLTRCGWAGSDPDYIRYHDKEWGVPVHRDRKLFEFLMLEGAQAGLSWITILRKRDNYKSAFDGFDFNKIARYGERDLRPGLSVGEVVTQRLARRRQLDGSEPFGIFGEHPSGWAYYGDGDVLIGRTPDFELVRYDRETDELEVLAPKIVDAFYFQENTDRGHPAQLIYEVGDLDDAEVPREFWTMPLSE